MIRFPGIQRSRQRKGLFAASSFLLLLSTLGLAQSGRKSVKPPQANIPQANDATVTPTTGARDVTHKVSLLVGRQLTSKHLLSEDAIFANFVNHLNEIKNVTAA